MVCALMFVKELAQIDPNLDPYCWVGPEIEASDLCERLINHFDIPIIDWGLVCEPFIEEIESMFDRHGVSWNDSPLIEIGSGNLAQ